jgi:transposase
VTFNLAALPDDVETLKRMIIEQQGRLQQKDVQLERRDTQIHHLNVFIAKLKFELARLKRARFGHSSEQLDLQIEQLEFLLEDAETQLAEAVETPSPKVLQSTPHREALPQHLPREDVVLAPSCDCPACGATMKQIGEDVSEMLELIPERFKVIRIVRPKLSCTQCDTIVQQDAPSRPIPRGYAGPGLLAHVLVSKYADHLPLYR